MTHGTNKITWILTALTLVVLTLASCSSRYRLDLFSIDEDGREKIDIEQTEVVAESVIGDDPSSPRNVTAGDGHVIILTVGSRGQTLEADINTVITVDRYVRCRLYLELPRPLPDGRVDLIDRSVAQLLGLYEIPEEDKYYPLTEGYLQVDSIAGSQLFATYSGSYENHRGDRLRYEGQFKTEVEDLLASDSAAFESTP